MTFVVRLTRLLFWLVLIALLAGCALRPSAPIDGFRQVSAERWMATDAPVAWQMRARAALALGDDGGTASLIWQQTDSGYRIDLRGALGAGSWRLQGDAAGVVLTTAAGERYAAQNARMLLRQVSGYDLPVDYLRYWLLGQPVPQLQGRVFVDQQDRLRRIEQGRWQIQLDHYQIHAGFRLPGRVTASGQDAQLTLLIRDWEVTP